MFLSDLKNGESETVFRICSKNSSKIRKLIAFGIVQAVEVKILQKYPAIVVEIGFTQVALDQEIGRIIEVKK